MWLNGHGVEECENIETRDFLSCEMPGRLYYVISETQNKPSLLHKNSLLKVTSQNLAVIITFYTV